MKAKDINWEAIASRLPQNVRTSVTTGDLPSRSFWILKAAANCANDSIRAKSKSLMNAQVKQCEESWFDDIAFYAQQRGLSFEDAFVQLALGEASGE